MTKQFFSELKSWFWELINIFIIYFYKSFYTFWKFISIFIINIFILVSSSLSCAMESITVRTAQMKTMHSASGSVEHILETLYSSHPFNPIHWCQMKICTVLLGQLKIFGDTVFPTSLYVRWKYAMVGWKMCRKSITPPHFFYVGCKLYTWLLGPYSTSTQ